MIHFFRKAFLMMWLGFIVFAISYYFYSPATFEPANLVLFFKKFGTHLLIVYFFVSLFRGITLIPSLPFVLAGSLLFPYNPMLVFTISIIGILFSALMIYYGSDWLGLSALFEQKFNLNRLKTLLDKYGVAIVFAWAFFPFAPTDAICYVAGITRMSLWKFLIGIFFGEAILCYSIIFLTHL